MKTDMTYDERAPLYIPSISMGPVLETMIKCEEYRFFQEGTGAPFYYPAILFSSVYMIEHDFMKIRSLCDGAKLIVGDSGGYQLATDAKEYTPKLRERIFDWLERYATFGLTLDWPPIATGCVANVAQSHIDNCLRKTVENNEYFAKHMGGHTKYLNVLHGRDLKNMRKWYEANKDFPFAGWASGGSLRFEDCIQTFAMLLEENALDSAEYFHVLGCGAAYVHIFAYWQMKIYEAGLKTRITFDASTPASSSAYGLWWQSTRRGMKGFHIGRLVSEKAGREVQKLPCKCPVCSKWDMMPLCRKKVESKFYARLGLHNVYQDLLHIADTWDFISNMDNFVLVNEAMKGDDRKLFVLIDEVFESGLRPFERGKLKVVEARKAKNIFSLARSGE